MDDLTSIDGLGLTFDDLSPNGKVKALFASFRKLEVSQVRDGFMQEMTTFVSETKKAADAAQEGFEQVGRSS